MPPSLPSRKRKASAVDDVVQTIQNLEKELTTAVSTGLSLNPLADLLDIALETENSVYLSKTIYSLYRVFVLAILRGLLSGPDRNPEARAVRTWLLERFHAFVELLAGTLKDEEVTLRTSALDIMLSLQKHLSSSLTRTADSKQPPQFHASHFRKIVSALLLCPPPPRATNTKKRKIDTHGIDDRTLDPEVRDHFVNTWLSVHDDIRWFFLRDAAISLAKHPHSEAPQLAGNLLSILERLTTFPTEPSELNQWWVEELGSKPPSLQKIGEDNDEADLPEETGEDHEDDWRKFFDEPAAKPLDGKKASVGRVHTLTLHQSLHSLAAHRAVFTKTWLALLPRLSLGSLESRKAFSLRVLNVLHRGVIPHLTRPILIMDWVSSSVDHGGTIGLLALNALFTLMKEYNLDYPSFYTRLYGFLDRDVLHLKHRARFFRLTELFLSSTHLPATIVASFVKRLSRLSLTAPPAAVIMLIPFTYNMLRRHPALMVMIHRSEDIAGADYDGFMAAEPNPALTNALESSLWELYSHRQHYHASVSTLAKIFEEAFTRPSYAMEDFLDHTYGTLFDTEVKRKIRKAPAVAPSLELSQVLDEDGLGDLWTIA
ncbi:CBF-domain-containing protein [Dichomitus squalens LYAD-421 SS1]|uniref:CBF-domain-containing protein n=1 Tax=Dichomitus squalens (strain LYAD-421) TaxID=732165 RepID=UPI00044138A8|nr:CBF-domain-containing protein [Dichomitus squalens LYAD-421 SS1]EJF62521.1 CBF-domain-containing protein [Dichomitus squalens LYAD-421 SS1]